MRSPLSYAAVALMAVLAGSAFAPGPDVLPVFSPDYTKLMWTRSPDGRSPSQLYIADFTPPKE